MNQRYRLRRKGKSSWVAVTCLLCSAILCAAGDEVDSTDFRALLGQGNQYLDKNDFQSAAKAFQQAIDLNPSSSEAHEGFGIALFRALMAESLHTSMESDAGERAEANLQQAADLSPSDPHPLLQLADLEALLADHAAGEEQREEHYRQARRALTQVTALEPSKPDTYLRLANLERDEFGPAVDAAKARFPKSSGPIPDEAVRRHLKQAYFEVINDAIHNAQQASERNGNSPRPLFLLSRLLRQRALLRDTDEQYRADMAAARDWEQQFLVIGGHLAGEPQ